LVILVGIDYFRWNWLFSLAFFSLALVIIIALVILVGIVGIGYFRWHWLFLLRWLFLLHWLFSFDSLFLVVAPSSHVLNYLH